MSDQLLQVAHKFSVVGHEAGRHAREEEEKLRLQSLDRSGLMETGDEERFDRIVRRAKTAFGTSAASIALIGAERQFLRSFIGPLTREVDRRQAFCNVTIQSEDLHIVTDALTDPWFSTTPLVLGSPFIRFYAGSPLRGPSGYVIGTLCVIDDKPRTFSEKDGRVLRSLAIEAELELNAGAHNRPAA
jgi:GAF domain-containing protein